MTLDAVCNLEAGDNADGFRPIAVPLRIYTPSIQVGVIYSTRGSGGCSTAAQALSRYQSASWTGVAISQPASYYTNGEEDSARGQRTISTNVTNGFTSTFQYTGLQYQFYLNLSAPWKGNGSIRIYWRLLTQHASAVARYVDYATTPEVLSDVTSQSYASMYEDVAPTQGATTVQAVLRAIDPTGLSPGDYVSVAGPPDLRWIAPYFSARQASSSAAKLGYLSYARPGNQGGSITNPQPVFQTETASTAPDAPAGTAYSGSQSVIPGAPPSTLGISPSYQSVSNAPSGILYYMLGDNDNAVGNRAQALALHPTQADWPQSLRLILSAESTTAELRSQVDPVVAAQVIPPAGQPVTGIPVPLGTAVVAWRFLPAHEQMYSVGKSIYSAAANVPINSGVRSLLGTNDLASTGSISFVWSRLVLDLDTGLFASPQAMQSQVSFTGNPIQHGAVAATSPVGCCPNGVFTAPGNLEDVPATNRRVSLYGLAWPPGATLECLDIGPQAEIIAAGG